MAAILPCSHTGVGSRASPSTSAVPRCCVPTATLRVAAAAPLVNRRCSLPTGSSSHAQQHQARRNTRLAAATQHDLVRLRWMGMCRGGSCWGRFTHTGKAVQCGEVPECVLSMGRHVCGIAMLCCLTQFVPAEALSTVCGLWLAGLMPTPYPACRLPISPSTNPECQCVGECGVPGFQGAPQGVPARGRVHVL